MIGKMLRIIPWLYPLYLVGCLANNPQGSDVSGTGSGGEAQIAGIVHHTDGAPVPGMTVALRSSEFNPLAGKNRGTELKSVTQADGSYAFRGKIGDSRYTLSGFDPISGKWIYRGDFAVATLDSLVFEDSLQSPAAATISLKSLDWRPGLVVYVPGTDIQVPIPQGDTLQLPLLPPGKLDLKTFDTRAGKTHSEGPSFEDVRFLPSDTLQLGQDLLSALGKASAGDTLWLDDGVYQLTSWLSGLEFPADNPVVVKSVREQGARFLLGQGFNIHSSRGIIFEGLEIAGPLLAGNLVQIHGGSEHISFINCHIHHAGQNGDCVQINGARNIKILRSVIHNPGSSQYGNEGSIDILNSEGVVVRQNLFKGTSSRYHVAARGGSRHVLLEANVVLEHAGDQGDPVFVLGGGGNPEEGKFAFEAEDITIRNNIVLNSATGALSFLSVKNAFIHNNLFLDCRGDRDLRGIIHATLGIGTDMEGGSRDIRMFNNVFANVVTSMPAQFMSVESRLENFVSEHNLYFNRGETIPGGYYPPLQEPGAVFENPQLPTPDSREYHDVVTLFSQASAGPVKEAGRSGAGILPDLGPWFDLLGRERGTAQWDIGPFESP